MKPVALRVEFIRLIVPNSPSSLKEGRSFTGQEHPKKVVTTFSVHWNKL